MISCAITRPSLSLASIGIVFLAGRMSLHLVRDENESHKKQINPDYGLTKQSSQVSFLVFVFWLPIIDVVTNRYLVYY